MRKKIINLDNHGTKELDRIVSHVLDAIESKVRTRLGINSDDWNDTHEEADFDLDRPAQKENPPETQAFADDAPDDAPSHDDWQPRQSEVIDIKTQKMKTPETQTSHEWDAISPELEVRLAQSDHVLFDEEEERFISGAVDFLKSRDNKDVIISRIWNHITEAEPDAFYSPETDEEQATDDAPKKDAPPAPPQGRASAEDADSAAPPDDSDDAEPRE